MDSLHNANKHAYLTEEIRQKVHEMEIREWRILFRWIRAYAGTSGNELADKLAKEASGKTELTTSYNRVPKSAIKKDLERKSLEKWQREWETKNKGGITKEYFPEIRERLHKKINLTQNFTNIVTDHGKMKSYLHRFKIIDTPNCPCGNGNQTSEHILLECEILQEDTERLIAEVAKTDVWPISKDMLIKKHYKAFAKFTKKMDKIQEINT